MDYRSLLVHVDDGESTACLDLAASLAGAFAAELQGAYLVPTRELTPFTSAMLPDSVVAHRLRDSGEAQARAEQRFREAAARKGLTDVSWSAPAGPVIDAAIAHARSADLCVLGQPRNEDAHAAFTNDLVHAVLMQSGRPALIVPQAGGGVSVGQNVLVAWKESRESVRAVADALPFLVRARQVEVVSISTERDPDLREKLSDTDVAAWLARHGIAATVRREFAEDIDAGPLILSRAADFGSDLLVMGAYSRPRLSEIVLGGVTRLMLDAMTVPVLMSH